MLTNLSAEMAAFALYIEKRGFKYIDSGASRHTYLRKKVVIKIPISDFGIYDNEAEAKAWNDYRNQPTSNGFRLAPCRLLPNGCLMMVTVDLDFDWRLRPAWSRLIDGAQVGLYRGEFVAYDYASDV